MQKLREDQVPLITDGDGDMFLSDDGTYKGDVMRYQVFATDSEAETWSVNHPGMFGISTEQ